MFSSFHIGSLIETGEARFSWRTLRSSLLSVLLSFNNDTLLKKTEKAVCFWQNESKTVEMMFQVKKLPYNFVPDLGLQILELPYVDDELSMIILLPEEASDGSNPLQKVWRVNLYIYLCIHQIDFGLTVAIV